MGDAAAGLPAFPAAVSAEYLFAVDGRQQLVAWNRSAARAFGFDGRPARGAPCYEIVGARDEAGRLFCREGCPVVRAAERGKAVPTLKLQVRGHDGSSRPVDVSTIVVFAEGEVESVIHLCRPGEPAQAPANGHGSGVPLTEREREVLSLLCGGRSTAAIATGLGISATTVRNHIQRLLEKLAVHSRAEAVARAFQERLIG